MKSVYFLLVILSLTACSKPDYTGKPLGSSTIASYSSEYQEYITSPKTGLVYINSLYNTYNQNPVKTGGAYVSGANGCNGTIQNIGIPRITQNYCVLALKEPLYSTLIGNSPTLTYIDSASGITVSGSVYLPSPIVLLGLTPVTVGNRNYLCEVKKGEDYVLNYNIDPLNTKGVIASVSYLSDHPENVGLGGNSFTKYFHTTADAGTFIIPSSTFDDVPKGAEISIDLVRGDFHLEKNSTLGNIGFETIVSNGFRGIIK